ncbi:MAG: leucine-rich repeat domain-containing protein [Candidatus Enterousia sp.]
MKKTLSLLLAVLMVITALPLTAITSFAATSGDFEYSVISEEDKTCEITGYAGTATNLAIPSTINGYSVTSIGHVAFSSCTSLTSITIPNSVTSIVSWAFEDCTSLASVVIGNGVTKIGESAFQGCTSLASITITDSVTSIGSWAFKDCTSLASITIPDSVTSIGWGALDNTAYYNDATNWENDVLYIGKYLIQAKDTISGDYVVKYGTKTIADNAFYYCTSLESVVIGNSVTSIGNMAFAVCTSLASVTIDNSVTSIGNWAFAECPSLTSITIPNSVTYIDEGAFSGCASLTDVYYTGTEAQWNAIEIGEKNEDLTSATINYNYVISNLNGLDNESSKQTGHDNDEKTTNKLVEDNQVWFYLGLIVAILIIVAIITWLVLSRRKRKNGNKQVD